MELSNPAQQRLACIGDASRFRLVVALAGGERCVTELAAAVGLSQSCTTRHLQTLQAAGLVHRIRYGKRVMVGLRRDEPELRPLFDYVLALAGRGETPPARHRSALPRRASAPSRPGPRTSEPLRAGRVGLARGAGGEQVAARSERRPAPPAAAAPPSAASGEREPAAPAPRRSEPLEDFLL